MREIGDGRSGSERKIEWREGDQDRSKNKQIGGRDRKEDELEGDGDRRLIRKRGGGRGEKRWW